jgi:hypothetical protein
MRNRLSCDRLVLGYPTEAELLPATLLQEELKMKTPLNEFEPERWTGWLGRYDQTKYRVS